MIITIAHTKGGVGKSTLAWNLANSFKDKKITIIDLDFQQTLYFVNVLSDKHFDVLQPQSVEELICELESIDKESICIVDVGGFDSDINRTVIEYSDKIVIPISESVTEILGFKTFENILEELSVKAEIYVLLNNVHPLTKNFKTIKEAVCNNTMQLLNTVVRSRKIFKTSMGNGASVFSEHKNNQAKNEIIGVRNELTGY